ncbi:GMC family oxidoreductase N-terminal domain-containing protein [Streptomyces angustmyceticus]|uniref:GMC family oxidoreductase N-terminal domain-containing protein n=1 Tax=Streptomyces angustmyceticus TaxID=285578 RepID=UPI0037F332E1
MRCRAPRSAGCAAAAQRDRLQGACRCVVVCSTGTKQSVLLCVLPDACRAGGRIVTGARALRILPEPDRPGGPRACGVVVRRPDDSGGEIAFRRQERPRLVRTVQDVVAPSRPSRSTTD